MHLRKVCVIVGALSQLLPSDVSSQAYHREDRQYYKNMLADIRNTRNHISWYRGDPVDYTNSKENPENAYLLDDNHQFWDVAFGETYSLFGFAFDEPADRDSFRKRGIDFFLEPQAHMLLDFSAQSNAVINLDFRGGAGFRGRGLPIPESFGAVVGLLLFQERHRHNWDWKWEHLSWRLRGFHESTHLGDEFVLDAARADALFLDEKIQYDSNPARQGLSPFQRYNVSYEAVDLYVAVDAGDPWELQPMPAGCGQLDDCGNPTEGYLENLDGDDQYVRGYIGLRLLDDGEYERYLKYSQAVVDLHPAINDPLLSEKRELQYGFEYFNELSRGASARSPLNPNLYIKALSKIGNVTIPLLVGMVPVVGIPLGGLIGAFVPDFDEARYGVIAADHYWRSLYVDEDPGYTLAGNYVVGLIWGEYFRANAGQRAFSLLASWYLHDGPNPHGQFRNDTLDYEKFNSFLPEFRFEINIRL